jgi:UDP-glucose 4-epimerase
MKALVTGGAGFIGSNIVERLVNSGSDVVVLDNLSSGYGKNLDGIGSVQLVEGDVRDAAAVANASQGVDVIFHLAASVGNKRSIDDPISDAEINVIGTLRVLEAARQNNVRKVIVSSSAGIFGDLIHLPIAEDHPTEPISPYGASKLAEEKLSLVYAALYDVEVICLRYFNVYGVRQRYDAYGNVIPIFAQRMLEGRPINIFGDGEQTRDFVNVRDVVSANLLACESQGFSGALNIASGTKATINELVRLMSEAGHLTPEVRHEGPRAGDVRDSLADVSLAKKRIGYEPAVTLQDGLVEYMAWAKGALV